MHQAAGVLPDHPDSRYGLRVSASDKVRFVRRSMRISLPAGCHQTPGLVRGNQARPDQWASAEGNQWPYYSICSSMPHHDPRLIRGQFQAQKRGWKRDRTIPKIWILGIVIWFSADSRIFSYLPTTCNFKVSRISSFFLQISLYIFAYCSIIASCFQTLTFPESGSRKIFLHLFRQLESVWPEIVSVLIIEWPGIFIFSRLIVLPLYIRLLCFRIESHGSLIESHAAWSHANVIFTGTSEKTRLSNWF